LPKAFRFKEPIVNVIGTVRHHFGAHLTDHPQYIPHAQSWTIERVYQRYLGSDSPPKPEQFSIMQVGMLRDFCDYLRRLQSAI